MRESRDTPSAEVSKSPFSASYNKTDISSPLARSSSSSNHDMTGSYREQVSVLNSAGKDVDYKTISKHLVNQEDTLKMQGGDVARYLYHQMENSSHDSSKRRTRSSSFSAYLTDSRRESTASDINVPGGFRREYLIQQSLRQRQEPPNFLTRNFIEFLSIYGHFAGEDFDDERTGEVSGSYEEEEVFDEESLLLPNERRELGPHPTKPKGTASTAKTYFLVFKSLVGSGVLFLPRAFYNGGLFFSICALSAFGILTYFCYYILVESKRSLQLSSFGELGYKTYGKYLRLCILISIIFSQVGFVATYILFTAENVTSFLSTYIDSSRIDTFTIVVIQAICLVPLVLIRNLTKLSFISLVSSLFIIVGFLIIIFYSSAELVKNGVGPNIVQFNSNSWSMLIGVAVTSFEGVGLILPIESSMAHPEKFPQVLFTSMVFITILFVSIGTIGYTAFGDDVKSIIILNLPSGSFSVQAIKLLYSLAVFLTAPLQLFPAIRIAESSIFNSNLFLGDKKISDDGKLYHNSGKYNKSVKWLKNFLRSLSVVIICFIAYYNSNNIDKFVSFNGCFACIPLVYIYPPLIHLRTYKQKLTITQTDKTIRVLDYLLIVVGITAVIYTTYQILFMN